MSGIHDLEVSQTPDHLRKRANSKNGWTVERWLSVVTLIVSITAFVFSLGVNYAQYTQLRSDFDRHVQVETNEYVRKDVADQRLTAIEAELTKLHKSFDELLRLLLQERLDARANRGAR